MKLLEVDLPGVVVKKAGKARVAVPSASNLREHHMVRAKRSKAQRTAAEKRLQAMLGLQVLLVARLTRVAPRRLDDDNLRTALKAYRDGVADALGLDNDRPGWLSWEYEQETGSPERVRLEVSVATAERNLNRELVAETARVCAGLNASTVAAVLPSVRTKAPRPAYTPPRTDHGPCSVQGCPRLRYTNQSPMCATHDVDDMRAHGVRKT